jgi:AraC-like DNA-binding protein/mannose-6-phosphate isomerase-like protein (cupin superfamily)
VKIYRSDTLMTEDASIHIFSDVCEKEEMPIHVHDFIEIIYVTDGSADQTINGETYHVRRGDLLFINYGSTHAFLPREKVAFINVCFKPEVLAESVITPENAFAVLQLTAFDEIRRASYEDGVVSFCGAEREELEWIVKAMLAEYREKKHSWQTVLKSYMNVLILLLLRKLVDTVEDSEQQDVWKELCNYIDSNLDADLSLSALAGKCFYNPSYFSRIFKQRYGKTLTEYLRAKRIKRAKELLSDTDMTVEQIIQKIGFSDRSAFYSAFYANTGSTPSEYRLKIQK